MDTQTMGAKWHFHTHTYILNRLLQKSNHLQQHRGKGGGKWLRTANSPLRANAVKAGGTARERDKNKQGMLQVHKWHPSAFQPLSFDIPSVCFSISCPVSHLFADGFILPCLPSSILFPPPTNSTSVQPLSPHPLHSNAYRQTGWSKLTAPPSYCGVWLVFYYMICRKRLEWGLDQTIHLPHILHMVNWLAVFLPRFHW